MKDMLSSLSRQAIVLYEYRDSSGWGRGRTGALSYRHYLKELLYMCAHEYMLNFMQCLPSGISRVTSGVGWKLNML